MIIHFSFNRNETKNFIKDIKNSVNNDIFENFLKKNNARFDVEDQPSGDSSMQDDSQDDDFNEEDFDALIREAGKINKIWMQQIN